MIYIGTSGFSYDDWKGHFYPEKLAKADMLRYYAGHFNCVEINSTFYAIPSLRSFEGMDKKTPQGFHFVVKAHQDMTHKEVPQKETCIAFLESVRPLRESGKLGCILAQYPWSFRKTPENIERLEHLRDWVEDVPTVVEFRNDSWISKETFDILRELGLGVCCVDEPRLKGLMPPMDVATSSIGYVRFHGRNAQKWWQHEAAYERYDYLYSEEELLEWAPKVKRLESQTDRTYVFFNNHFRGKSAQNAKMFARMLDVKTPTDAGITPRQIALGDWGRE